MTAINKDVWLTGQALNGKPERHLIRRLLTYQLEDMVVLLNGLTGAIDRLTPCEHNLLTDNIRDFEETYPELTKELASRGYLFDSEDGEKNLEKRLLAYIEEEAEKKEMVFMMCPTDFCPVGCNYCFAEDRVLEAGRGTMSDEMIDSAFKSIEEIRAKYPSRLSTMCLYGGEPFQNFTRTALEKIFARSRDNGLRIAGFTSGLQTFKFKELLAEYKEDISTIAVTLDGLPNSHHRLRKVQDSFERAVKTIDVLLEIGVPVLIKSNVNRSNINDLPKLVEYYKEKGWWSNSLTKYELTPIQYKQITLERDTNFDLEMAFSFLDMQKENPEFEKFDILPMADNKYGMLDGFGFRSFPKEKVPLQAAVPRIHSCPSYSKHFFVFTADGDFYLCNEEVGLKESSFGSFGVSAQGGCSTHHIDFDKMEEYYSRDVCSLSPCTDCGYAYFCGGGCGHHAGGEDLAMCGTIHTDFGEVIRRWAGVDRRPILPKTGVQLHLGESAMKEHGACKPSAKEGMRGIQ
jgi:uncharacterized protein